MAESEECYIEAARPVIWPFLRADDRLEETVNLLHLAIQGIARTTVLPELSSALEKFTGERSQAEKEQVSKVAELAKREVERGFPLLHAQAAISLWSILEVAVEDFAVAWLSFDRTAIQSARTRKINVPLHRFMGLDDEERLRFLVRRMQEEVDGEFSKGIGHFEPLLDSLGFGGGLEEPHRRDLVELAEMRNCIVHRGAVADRKLREACNWLNLKSNEPVIVTHDSCMRYCSATSAYLAELVYRIRFHFGDATSKPFASRSSGAP